MWRWIAWAACLYGAAVLDTTAGNTLAIGRAAPDWLTLVGFAWLVTQPRRGAVFAAGISGLLADLVAAPPLGYGLAAMLVVGFAVDRRPDWYSSAVARVLGVGFAAALVSCSVATGQHLTGTADLGLARVLSDAAGIGLYTAGASVPVFLVAAWLPAPETGWLTKTA